MPGPNPGAADRAAAQLTRDPYRSDTAIAAAAACAQQTVSRIRAELAAAELIPAVPLRSRAGYGRNPQAYDRATQELVTNPYRSNYLIAQLADCSAETAGRARCDMEHTGLIAHIPAIERIPKLLTTTPRPQATSAARHLIDDPVRSDGIIAEVAGCSRVTAGRARIQLEAMGLIQHVPASVRATRAIRAPRYADAAASTDAITVQATARCARCRQPFTFTPHPGRPSRRHCGCCGPARRLPRIIELPPPPDWSRGLCTRAPADERSFWTSGHAEERAAAAETCQHCPVLSECERWSLSLPPDDDTVYAGHGADGRRRLRRALASALPWLLPAGARCPGPAVAMFSRAPAVAWPGEHDAEGHHRPGPAGLRRPAGRRAAAHCRHARGDDPGRAGTGRLISPPQPTDQRRRP